MKSQNALILRDLKKGKSITPLQALREYGCMRLSARIYDLRALGVVVGKEMKKQKDHRTGKYKRYARYFLTNGANQ